MYLGGLCFITERKASNLPYGDMVFRVLRAGVRWVQYRDKDRTRREIYEESVRLRSITRDFEAVLVVNDHPDIALASEADGVHLGQEDLPLKEARKILGGGIIGISTHSLAQAADAEKGGADYIGFGPVFHTVTKNAGSPKGVEMLHEVKESLRIPIVAIGGITLENLSMVLETGVDAIAVASAILSGDIEKNAAKFMDIIKSYGKG
jgi:thiamine-phosphate pyrophosphorylase